MHNTLQDEAGITLVETLIAILVLTVGAVGMAATFLHGMSVAGSSPAELTATQKAAEAVESVYSARDSHTITWAQLKNRADGGIFIDGATEVRTGGADGIINTGDDGEVIESVTLPGPDQNLETEEDNRIETLVGFTREIRIEEISSVLRSLTVIITYKAGATTQTYTLTTYISAFA
jgi:type II secretory pathway pseudopilin PulG